MMSIENDWMKINEWSPPHWSELQQDANARGRTSVLYARRSDLKWVRPTEIEEIACYQVQIGSMFIYTLENPMPELEDL